jgi:hypothetical protein
LCEETPSPKAAAIHRLEFEVLPGVCGGAGHEVALAERQRERSTRILAVKHVL